MAFKQTITDGTYTLTPDRLTEMVETLDFAYKRNIWTAEVMTELNVSLSTINSVLYGINEDKRGVIELLIKKYQKAELALKAKYK